MKTVIAAVLMYLSISCAQNSDTPLIVSSAEKDAATQNLNSSQIAIIEFDRSQNWLFSKSKPARISHEELSEAERLLQLAVQEHNSKAEGYWIISNLDQYRRQYVAVINEKGEKEVWINCFCSELEGWTKEIIVVKDGGKCYFNLKVNLTARRYYDFGVNGVA
jgi:hypothetical protein